MSTKSTRAQRFLAKALYKEKDAADAADAVHAHLSGCFDEDTYPNLEPELVKQAAHAKPSGTFPSAAMLMLMFEDLL